MRLFIAIDLPQEIKEKAQKVEQEMQKLHGSFTFVKPDAMHITLNFIGEVDKDLADKAKAALSSVSFTPFKVHLEGLSYFSPSFIRVVYASIKEGSAEAKTLFETVGEALTANSVPYEHGGSEAERFVPHFTLARVKYIKEKKPLLDFINAYSDFDFGSFTVRSITLKQSTLSEAGPVYSDLYKVEV